METRKETGEKAACDNLQGEKRQGGNAARAAKVTSYEVAIQLVAGSKRHSRNAAKRLNVISKAKSYKVIRGKASGKGSMWQV